MNLLYSTLLFLLLLLSETTNSVVAQNREKYSKAKIGLSQTLTLKQLASLGVETEHGEYKPGRFFISGFSAGEINRIRANGFPVEILIEDVSKDFEQKSAETPPPSTEAIVYAGFCRKVKEWKIPRHWRHGTMGGHLRYDEMVQHLDSMRILFPNLISVKKAIDTTKTIEGRQILGVKISDNPDQNEPEEPKALFTAIHHAREPVGMHQLILFMWYLLENYTTDQNIKALVNSSEFYFVPCINPDGYIFNQTQNPNGGGMWRKNRRDNGDGSFGVDLNRNYGFNWGYDDFGSSPNPNWETFRGETAFSEPENRAMKAFCEQIGFKAALNYHTYANLLIHPWGYEDIPCEDSTQFRFLGREMVKENNYRIGTAMQVLNYNTNGGSDDYMYSDSPEKPKIISMTPEAGNWFWPTQNEILDLCVDNLHQNLTFARSIHPLLSFKDTTGLFFNSGTFPTSGINQLRYKLRRIGTNADLTNFQVTFRPFGLHSATLQPIVKNYPGLGLNKEIVDSVFLVPANPAYFDFANQFSWRVEISNGIFTQIDTIIHFSSLPEIPENLKDGFENQANWTGNWTFVTDDAVEGQSCLKPTDGNYQSSMDVSMRRVRPFDLRSSSIKAAEMSFWTKYGIEKNYDYASIEFSTDSLNWTTVCTDKSVLSSPFSQQAGANIIPIWDGFQSRWQKEYIDLKDYLGYKLWVRFVFHSDDFTEFEGFRVDDIQVKIGTNLTGTEKAKNEFPFDFQLMPNPGNGKFEININGIQNEPGGKFTLLDVLGKPVFEKWIAPNGRNQIETNLPKGIYFARFETGKSGSKLVRLLIQ